MEYDDSVHLPLFLKYIVSILGNIRVDADSLFGLY